MGRRGTSICTVIILLVLLRSAAANEPPRPDLQRLRDLILAGLDSLYNAEFDGALAVFERLDTLDSTHPAGPFYTAVALASKAVHRRTPGHRLESLTEAPRQVPALLDEAVRRAQARLAAAPPTAGSTHDPTIHLILAGALAFKGQRQAEERHFLSAWDSAKQSYAHLLAAAAQPGGEAEAAYGLGSLHYHLARLTGFSRVIVGWLFVSGDKDRGLHELETAAEKAVYARTAARIELAYIYADRERRYSAALPYAAEAARRYRNNSDFAFLLANIYSELGRPDEANAVADAIRSRLEAGTYEEALWPRYEHLVGKIALDHGALADARKHFLNALHVHDDGYLWVKAWALTRLGMVEDLEGKRAAGVARYREALALKSGGSAEEAAKAGLKRPYSRSVRTSTASGR